MAGNIRGARFLGTRNTPVYQWRPVPRAARKVRAWTGAILRRRGPCRELDAFELGAKMREAASLALANPDAQKRFINFAEDVQIPIELPQRANLYLLGWASCCEVARYAPAVPGRIENPAVCLMADSLCASLRLLAIEPGLP